jgi:hypothetical protein
MCIIVKSREYKVSAGVTFSFNGFREYRIDKKKMIKKIWNEKHMQSLLAVF